MLTWTIIILLHLASYMDGKIYVPGLPRANYKKIGEFNIGVLMPVHKYSRSEFCGNEVTSLGTLQRIEAIDYVVKEINDQQGILDRFTMGYVIFDDCSKDVTALAQALRFRKAGTVVKCEYYWPFGGKVKKVETFFYLDPCSNDTLTQYSIIGVIAAETSALTVQIANMLTAFKIPQISYMASSGVLSDKEKYPYFMRPIPSDHDQIQIIIDLLVKFNWKFVSVIYTEGPYGTTAFNSLRFRAERINICFAETYEIGDSLLRRQYGKIVEDLVAVSDKASVVIVIAYLPQVRTILENYNILIKREKQTLTWIATDTWGLDVAELKDVERETKGMLSINMKTSNVERFDEHFLQLVPHNETRNPWFYKFWEDIHGCKLGRNRTCSDHLRFNDSTHYKPDKFVSELFNGVYTYAHALDGIITNPCRNYTKNDDLYECVDEHLLNYMRQAHFEGESSIVQYDNNGDGVPNYEILNMQEVANGRYQLKKVGYYNASRQLVLNESEIQWVRGVVPKSSCSQVCGVGQQQRRREAKCCWDCEMCQDNQIVTRSFGWLQCRKCEDYLWPEPINRTECVLIKPRYLRWNYPESIAISSVAGLGIIVSILILILFFINNQNQLIKSCGRELSYLMLMGIIFSYSLTFSFIGNLTDSKCTMNLYGIGLSFASIYGPLLTKTNRIYRIFQAGKKTRQRPPLIESKYQVSIALLIIGVLFLLLTVGILVQVPEAQDHLSSQNIVERICRFPVGPFMLGFIYNAILVLACAFYAFKTRLLPDNYNESKFIAFCVYSTLFLWCAFVPIYFIIPVAYYRVLILMIAIIINASVTLICLYIPKLFAIYFVTKKSDSAPSTQNSTVGHSSFLDRFRKKTKVVPFTDPNSPGNTQRHSVEAKY